jgi:SWIM zinc finger
MKLMIETTVFAGAKMPNHSYMLDDAGIAIGMRKFSQGVVVKFRTPILLDRRGRTFKLVDDLGPDTPVSSNIVEVAGSGSNVYTVDLDNKHCTCTGFSFRGDCKHIAIAESQK